MHLGCVKHLFGVDMGFLGLHIGSMGHVRPQFGTLRPSLASPSHLGLGLVLYDPSQLLRAISVPSICLDLDLLSTAPRICSVNLDMRASSIRYGSFEPELLLLEPNLPLLGPICPPRARSALLGLYLPSTGPICPPRPRSGPPRPILAMICSSSSPICSLRLETICSSA
uniref:Uncharacterized protein n=1 Tax=Fagus sylvatica TaxID=28930 RepID=A0A2N9HKX5_FAGSY